MVISARDVSLERGGRALLNGLSFDLAASEALALRGPNGTGKTSLLRAIAGLGRVAQGEIEVDPEAVLLIGHLDAVKPSLTVAENLAFWARMFGAGPDLSAALDSFGLAPLAERRAAHLSAGQRRRLGLSRLAVIDRPLWLLDEPTVSLDTANTARFAALLSSHLAKGGAAIIATHIDFGIETRVLELSQHRARAA